MKIFAKLPSETKTPFQEKDTTGRSEVFYKQLSSYSSIMRDFLSRSNVSVDDKSLSSSTEDEEEINLKMSSISIGEEEETSHLITKFLGRWFWAEDDDMHLPPRLAGSVLDFDGCLFNHLEPEPLILDNLLAVEPDRSDLALFDIQQSFFSLQQSFTLFKKQHTDFMIANRHQHPLLQQEYDKEFGLIHVK